METTNLDEADATFAVDYADGRTRGDVDTDPPLTAEERRRLGLDICALDDETDDA